jgi:hypothetical protein
LTHPTRLLLRSAAFLLTAVFAVPGALAQAHPTADRTTRLSVFAGATGTEVGLYTGHNAGVTAGADLEVYHFLGLQPAIEVRGTYPVSGGAVLALRNAMGGLRLEKHYGRIHPYGDFLFGRGEQKYQGGGVINTTGSTIYLQSLSNVYSPGGGAELDLTRHFALKLDAQFQHYNSPVTESGSEWAKAGTIGVTYRIGLGGYRTEH